MSAPPPPPKGGGMSLYANLLNPKADASASISGAPVLYDNSNKDDAAARKEANAALRFQPIRRPQINQKKPTKPGFPKAVPPPNPTVTSPPNENRDTTAAVLVPPPPQPPQSTSTPPPGGHAPARTTLADWAAANDEDEYLWGAGAAEKRQRGGRRAAKKKKKQLAANSNRETDWDEIYDPARPTNVDEYLRSDERIREVQEWKAVLYAHRRRDRRGRRGSYDDDEDSEEDSEAEGRAGLGNQFAPPADYSFAPPPMSPPPPPPPPPSPPIAAAAPTRDPPAAAPIPDDATGDDAYARRLALSGIGAVPPPTGHTPTPPVEQAAVAGATISRGPVRYEAPPQPSNLPPPPPPDTMDLDNDDEDDDEVNVDDIVLPPTLGLGATPDNNEDSSDIRSNRPGQAGFAQRLMSKYGWTAGSGLGASSSGIINPLQVKLEKRRRRPDAEGGGFADPGGRGKVIAPSSHKNNKSTSINDGGDSGKFGPMSTVILLANMLQNMPNLQDEIQQGLGQEIGEECGDKYGRVERLHIDVEGRQVFIQFTDAVSALRAVNALEGRVFNGNVIAARFWDAEKFERGEYR